MPKISFSGEHPEPFDGMMMSYDAKAAEAAKKAEKAARKASYFAEKKSEDGRLDAFTEQSEFADSLVQKDQKAMIDAYLTDPAEKIRTQNSKHKRRTGLHKGQDTIRKKIDAESPISFEVPEDNI